MMAPHLVRTTHIYTYVLILNYSLVQVFDVRFINGYAHYGITDISTI